MNDELDEDISGSFVVREAEDVTEGGSDEGVARVGHNKLSRRADTPPPKRRRSCFYDSEWEDKFPWVTKCPDDQTKARCKICCSSFTVAYDGAKALVQHAETQKHQRNIEAAKASKRMSSFFVKKDSSESVKVTVAELTHVYHGVKHHLSFLSQECAANVMKAVFDDSEILKKFTCGRTKASAIVNNVLYPFSVEVIMNDLKSGTGIGIPFSVATDASNKGNRKVFPVAVQYFTPREGMCFKVLDFYEDAFEDSRSVKDQLCRVIQENGLSWANVSAYGADNASVNYGTNNSVFEKLSSEENSDIVPAHCNDHILHNCAKYALRTLSVDIENLVLKVFSEFSCSAKKREQLKECFEFCQSQFQEVIRHVPTRWLSLHKAVERLLLSWKPLKSYFLALGSDECPKAVWTFLSDQEHEMANDDEPTFSELYLYFVHFFMSSFQDTMLKLENRSTLSCDLYTIMDRFRSSLRQKLDDKFFGMKVKVALRKGYLPTDTVNRFTADAIQVYTRALFYLEKWFPFNSPRFRSFSALGIGNMDRAPSLDEVIDIWMLSPWKNELPPDTLHDEISALQLVFFALEGSSLDRWKTFFTKEIAPNLLKLVQYVASIPVSNAGVERVFSVMGSVWTDERNRLTVESVRSELCVFFNLSFSCTEFKDLVAKNRKLIKAAESSAKYTVKATQ